MLEARNMGSGASEGAELKWPDIWKLFEPDEQHQACLGFVEALKEDWAGATTQRLLQRLAKGTGTRLVSIEIMVRTKPDKAATLIRTRALALLDDSAWVKLFGTHYLKTKPALLRAFLASLGIEHDDAGVVASDFGPPSPEVVSIAVESLLRTYTVHEVARYLAVLVNHADGWAFLTAERDRVLQMFGEERRDDEKSAVSQGEATSASSMEFGTLDRVITEQIVRTAMEIDGCLDAHQLDDLVDSAIHLNATWYRAYFHLGFMDVLIAGREMRFDHAGDNQLRRNWYLAGVIAALVRSNELGRLSSVLEKRTSDLQIALGDAGGPGASIVRTAFRSIVDAGRISDVLTSIRGQLGFLGMQFASEVLSMATAFIRQAQYERAKVLVDELGRHKLPDDGDAEVTAFRLELSRRRAQCLQAAGDFEGAEREYRDLLKAGEDNNSPDLLADLGLVKGRFRSIAEVRLPEGPEARVQMRESLAKGEVYFKRAADRFGIGSPKAAYPLAALEYLRWTFSDQRERERRRQDAAALASNAVTAILASESGAVYRGYGALGQSQFMLAVMRMNSYEDVQGREALAAWQTITGDAGRFPAEDLRLLLQGADMFGPDIADPIAESIWEFRKGDSAEILKDGPWMTHSTRLRAELKSMAQSESTPRAERIRLWISLIPLIVQGDDIRGAEDGLGELERLAETVADIQRVLDFLRARPNYDPAWSEVEAGMARVYLLRRLGLDADCAQELRRMFYLVRDIHTGEAQQILEIFEEWRLDRSICEELQRGLPKSKEEELPGVEERLRRGEAVRLIFIGGNETQAQYDDAVRSQISNEWPQVTVQFEHSAWSSNWGRDLSRLVELANEADAVVLMTMMRTTLGRRIRAALRKPWLSCAATGKGGMFMSLQRAARLVVSIRAGKTA